MIELEKALVLARSTAVAFDLTDSHAVVSVSGRDRVPFLQAILTNDVAGLPEGSGHHSAILDRKSSVLADFRLFRAPERILLFTEAAQAARIVELLEGYVFSEDVALKDHSGAKAIVAVQGPTALDGLRPLLDPGAPPLEILPYRVQSGTVAGHVCDILSPPLIGEPGVVLVADADIRSDLLDQLTPAAAVRAGDDAMDILRIEAGRAVYGRDIDDSILALEVGRDEELVSFDKGCYPGQEIVARIAARSSAKKKLMGLRIEGRRPPPAGAAIEVDGRQVGDCRSGAWSPSLQAALSLAYVNRELYAEPAEHDMVIEGAPVRAAVVDLPFYVSPRWLDEATNRLRRGLELYHGDDNAAAATELETAIAIKPDFADAWEALAVVAERLGDHDRAIRLNRKFARIDPTAVMARTNLSRLYMLKGWKERAEEEQVKATMLKFRAAAKTPAGAGQLEEDAKRQAAAEAERRMGLFQQVLELDPEDEVANFGLGKIYLETDRPEEAVKALSIVLRNNERYSVAYELLGKALRRLGRDDEARDAFTRGIAVAKEQGDLMPMNSMQHALDNPSPSPHNDSHARHQP